MNDSLPVQAIPVTSDPVAATVAALVRHDATCGWCMANLGRPGAARCAERDDLFAARRRYSLGDRICACAGAGSDEGVTRPRMFEIGHQIGELGWSFR